MAPNKLASINDSIVSCRLGVFLKAPRVGEVKTRLGRSIGMAPAARLYRCFSQAVIEQAMRLHDVETSVFYAPADAIDACRQLLPPCRHSEVRLEAQIGGDLGGRMADALRQLLGGTPSPSPARAVLIGTDAPSVDEATLRQAFDALRRADVVLGPALDGGYYLVGMNGLHEDLFRNVPWSTEAVLPETVKRCQRLGLTVHFLEEKRDIDVLDDLRSLWDDLESARRRGAAFPREVWEACRDVLTDPTPPQSR